MDTSARQPSRGYRAFAQKVAFVVAVLVLLTGAIIIAVHEIIDRAVHHAVKEHAAASAMDWVARFNADLSDRENLLSNGRLSQGQRRVIDAAMLVGNVYAFNIYDREGRTVFSSDYGVIEPGPGATANEEALAVVTSGATDLTVIQKTSPSGNLNVFVDAMVPAKRPDGTVLGTIQLYLDKSDISSLYKSANEWIAYLLPAVCAIIYAVPAAAFILMREKAFTRQEHVRHLSMYDTLTGVLNRHTMNIECKKLFAARGPQTWIGVLFIDVDKFKGVNDLFGHEFGDAYLQHIAGQLKNCIGAHDYMARIGGDEFVVVCPDMTATRLEALAKALLDASRAPFSHKGTSVQGSLSIGTRLAPPDETVTDAFHAADLALYHAKANGRNRAQGYFPALDAALTRRCVIEARLRQALEQNDFDVNYQQLVKPADRSVCGFEALLRLNDDHGNPIPPAEFIPVAEDAGIIHDLGLRTLRRAIGVAKTWPDHVFLSVNLSPAQFQKGDLDKQVEAVVSELGFPASRLDLEVTETLLMGDEESVSAQLMGLKRLGICITMDDFGTGYSSLGYLWKYDFDKLKIDRVFLEGLDFAGDRYRDIIETIVALGKKIGIKVTVEGVETEAHTEMLDRLPCDQYQGFLFGRPMPADETLKHCAPEPRSRGAA